VAKRRDSKYEPGQRSGAWQKMRVNAGQELVIGGYTPSDKNFDALVVGYYEDDKLIYAARTRNGFTPSSRAELFKKIKPFEIKECPFANLPEKKAGRWGAGLTAAKMAECRWLLPELVAQFEFVEWTADAHLRHSRYGIARRQEGTRCQARGLNAAPWQLTCYTDVMADDKKKTAPQDAQRINVHEDYEVRYWSTKFGCTEEQLKAAVKKVGVMAKDVEAELKHH